MAHNCQKHKNKMQSADLKYNTLISNGIQSSDPV